MLTNTRDHFVQGVLPAYKAFLVERDDPTFGEKRLLRLGVEAATRLYHMREHITPKPGYRAIVQHCPEYALVRDVANLAKHKHLTYQPLVTKITEVLKTALFDDEAGEYSHFWVEVELTAGASVVSMADVLREVLVFWSQKLDAEGIIPGLRLPAPLKELWRVDRTTAKTVPMEVVRGEARTFEHQFLRFNKDTGIPEPMDLTGATVEFRLFKIPEEAELDAEWLGTGVKASVKIRLTPEQGRQVGVTA